MVERRWSTPRRKTRDVFVGICSRLIPHDVAITIEQGYGGLDPNDVAILRAIKDAIPNANSRSPTEVLEYVRDTLRAAQAKQITADDRRTVEIAQ